MGRDKDDLGAAEEPELRGTTISYSAPKQHHDVAEQNDDHPLELGDAYSTTLSKVSPELESFHAQELTREEREACHPVPLFSALLLAPATVLAGWYDHILAAWAVAFLTSLSATVSIYPVLVQELPLRVRLRHGLGPLGVLLAGSAMIWLTYRSEASWLTNLSVTFAALAVVGRTWLYRWSQFKLCLQAGKAVRSRPRSAKIPRSSHESTGDESEKGLALVDAETLRPGDTVVLQQGDVLSVDSVIKDGSGMVRVHPLASRAQPCGIGDKLGAGAQLTRGMLRLVVAKPAGCDGWRRVLLGKPSSSDQRRKRYRAIAWLAHYSPFALASVAGVCVLAAMMMSEPRYLNVAATVLIVAPLLALEAAFRAPTLAVAVAFLRRGIRCARWSMLDRLGSAERILFDVQGTLTAAEPTIGEASVVPGSSPDDLHRYLALAAGVEAGHPDDPLGRALCQRVERLGIEPLPMRGSTRYPGKGVMAYTDSGSRILIGNRRFMVEQGVGLVNTDDVATPLERRGHNVVFLAEDDRVRCVLSFVDRIRDAAGATVQILFDRKLDVVLLSGDHHESLRVVAERLDVEHLKADLSRDERLAEMKRLQESEVPVATIAHPGFGPDLLSAATLPVAFGESLQLDHERVVSITSERLSDVPALFRGAQLWRRHIIVGLSLSVGLGGLFVTAAVSGFLMPATAALAALCIDIPVFVRAKGLLAQVAGGAGLDGAASL